MSQYMRVYVPVLNTSFGYLKYSLPIVFVSSFRKVRAQIPLLSAK